MAGLVVPRAIRGTGLYGREDMDQARMIPAVGHDLLNARLFAEVPVTTNELDLHTRLGGQPLGVLTQFLAQWLGPLGVVEDADPAGGKQLGHGRCMADLG